MKPRRVVFSAIVLAPLTFFGCEDSSEQGTPVPDAGVATFDAPTDANPPPTADSAPPPTDAGVVDATDSGLKGTGLGLRVTFLGAPHSFGVDDESSLFDLFTADTTLVPARANNPMPFDAAFLANVDVLVLDSLTRIYTLEESQVLRDWVAAGHGLIAMTGYGNGAEPNTDSMLQAFDVGFTGGNNGTDAILAPNGPHPVVEGVSGIRYYGGRTTMATNASSFEFATYLASPKGIASKHGLGRSVLYADEWIVLDQEVNRIDGDGGKPTQRFWRNALLWAGGRID